MTVWIRFILFLLDRINRIIRIILFRNQFPDVIDPTQSAWRRKLNITLFTVLEYLIQFQWW